MRIGYLPSRPDSSIHIFPHPYFRRVLPARIRGHRQGETSASLPPPFGRRRGSPHPSTRPCIRVRSRFRPARSSPSSWRTGRWRTWCDSLPPTNAPGVTSMWELLRAYQCEYPPTPVARRGSHSARHPKRPERPPPPGVAPGVPTPSAQLSRRVVRGCCARSASDRARTTLGDASGRRASPWSPWG
jgi:hypothetical protein